MIQRLTRALNDYTVHPYSVQIFLVVCINYHQLAVGHTLKSQASNHVISLFGHSTFTLYRHQYTRHHTRSLRAARQYIKCPMLARIGSGAARSKQCQLLLAAPSDVRGVVYWHRARRSFGATV